MKNRKCGLNKYCCDKTGARNLKWFCLFDLAETLNRLIFAEEEESRITLMDTKFIKPGKETEEDN